MPGAWPFHGHVPGDGPALTFRANVYPLITGIGIHLALLAVQAPMCLRHINTLAAVVTTVCTRADSASTPHAPSSHQAPKVPQDAGASQRSRRRRDARSAQSTTACSSSSFAAQTLQRSPSPDHARHGRSWSRKAPQSRSHPRWCRFCACTTFSGNGVEQLKHARAQAVPLKAGGESALDTALVRHDIHPQVQANKPGHQRRVIQGFFCRHMRQTEPLLQKVKLKQLLYCNRGVRPCGLPSEHTASKSATSSFQGATRSLSSRNLSFARALAAQLKARIHRCL